MCEEELAGGRTTASVVRVDDTVYRSASHRSVFVAALLTYLRSINFPYAPRHLGTDDEGRDVLTYIPGQTTSHPSERAADSYRHGGRMLCALHDVTAGHSLAADAECVMHGDPGPYNTIFRGGMPVAFIDWDAAAPGSRIADLGYMAWTWCIQAAGNVPISDQAEHLRLLRDGYGPTNGSDLLAAVIRAQTAIAEGEEAVLDDASKTDKRRAHAREAVDWATSDREIVQANYDEFLAALDH